ncbi:hypothetical protein Acor_70590 [Acrocarpospora corrugata]|uniref:Uncharacterized protein n=1 Tax=Acrocarpospora corrugata TaxID=35763 RepID=A0A5M3WD28_9ACTN|nr:hypothetical protein Acor_70590 [Acrocarpospora corrugata]
MQVYLTLTPGGSACAPFRYAADRLGARPSAAPPTGWVRVRGNSFERAVKGL